MTQQWRITGVVVNGENVTAYGLFVEHYQKYEVIGNGNGGTDIFFQNENAWMTRLARLRGCKAPGVDRAAFKVASHSDEF